MAFLVQSVLDLFKKSALLMCSDLTDFYTVYAARDVTLRFKVSVGMSCRSPG